MSPKPLKIDRFDGLNVSLDPAEVGPNAAVDLVNVDFDRAGRLRTRGGLSQADDSGGTTSYTNGFAHYRGETPHLFLFRRDTSATDALIVDKMTGGVISNVGTITASTNDPRYTSHAVLGTPTSTLLFIASADVSAADGVTLRKWDGSTFGNSTGQPKYVAVTPWDNRLAQAAFYAAADTPSGANGSLSTVFFSDAGAPETYTSTNFIHLRPGDGEEIVGMVSWNDLLFVFKPTSMFVFYGTSTDPTGGAIFNYNWCPLPTRLIKSDAASDEWMPCAVGPDGVYITTDKGVFRTTGPDQFTNVTADIAPLFDGSTDSDLAVLYNQLLQINPTVDIAAGSLFVRYHSTGAQVLVYHFRSQRWTAWNFPSEVQRFIGFYDDLNPGDEEKVYAVIGDDHVYEQLDSNTTDDGTAITWDYTSGWYNPSGEDEEVRTRRTSLRGSGSPTIAVLTNYGTTDANAAAVTLGTAPASDEGFHNVAYRGSVFAHKLSGTAAATIDSVTHWVADVRGGGARSS